MIGAVQDAGSPEGAPSPRMKLGGQISRSSENSWLKLMFWWTEYCPSVVLFTRRLFLWGAWRFSGSLREGTLANAARILGPGSTPPQREALAKDVIRNFYLSVYELGKNVRLTREALAQKIDDVEHRERYDAIRREGRGAIVVTAHLGGFELGMASLSAKERRVHVVYQHDAIERFDRLRSRLREQVGVVESAVGDGWSLWARLRDALVADEVVVLQADRVMPGQHGVWVPFFDGHFEVATGAIKLALASGAPIIPIFSIRTSTGRVKVVIEEPIWVSRADGPVNDEHPAVRRIAATVERHVRANPEQWSMVYPVWREDLPDADGTA